MGATDSLYAYAHRPKAILSASWDGLFALLGGRYRPGARDLLPHMLRMTRFAMDVCYMLGHMPG